SADAAVAQNKATLIESKQKLERARGQLAGGLIAQQDFEALEAAWARAEAAVKSAQASATLSRASLKSARSRLTKTTIVSPIDGIVLSRLVEPGQTVTAGMTTPVLFKLAQDLRKMELSVMVDEADIGRVREGQEASFTVDTYPDKVFSSRVVSVRNDPVTTQNVVTYESILSVDNGELLLRPGMTAAATVVIATHSDVLALPNAALRFAPSSEVQAQLRIPGVPSGPRKATVHEKQDPRVWILDGGVPAPVTIRTGASDGAFTEVIDGPLKVGSAVVVDVEEKDKEKKK
ncbi:MAG TPA: efflux RND transporter periplasmic adaptor subunit, partial [Polyangiaceae bacterium]|nr:efflux RND transporter periplasmic adaptor subunit [Polyangiaceae bacterium]